MRKTINNNHKHMNEKITKKLAFFFIHTAIIPKKNKLQMISDEAIESNKKKLPKARRNSIKLRIKCTEIQVQG